MRVKKYTSMSKWPLEKFCFSIYNVERNKHLCGINLCDQWSTCIIHIIKIRAYKYCLTVLNSHNSLKGIKQLEVLNF